MLTQIIVVLFIHESGCGFSLKDNPSNYGTDIVTNVERIKFADSSLALDLDANAGPPIKSRGCSNTSSKAVQRLKSPAAHYFNLTKAGSI